MKLVVVALGGVWLGGILFGAGAWWWGAALGVAGLAAGWNSTGLQRRIPVVVVMLGLAGLGWLHGQVSGLADVSEECRSVLENQSGIIVEREIRVKNVRYVVTDNRGCKTYVYADRFPVHGLGDEVEWLGGSSQEIAEIRADNPGYGEYLLRQAVSRVIYYPRIRIIRASSSRWREARSVVANNINSALGEPEASLAKAMWLAEKGEVPADIKEKLQNTGVGHIMAISGLHVGIVAGMILLVTRLIPARGVVQAGVGLVILWLYVWFVGAPVSAVRAAGFWSLATMGMLRQRLLGWVTVFAIAGMVMVSVRPEMIFDAGMQLSFAAVVGIWAALFLLRKSEDYKQGSHAGWVKAAAVTGGAWVTTWPIIAYYFGIFSWVSLAANLLVVPTVPLFLTGAALAVIGHQIYPPIGMLLSFSVHAVSMWILGVTEILLSLPAAVWEIGISVKQINAYYLGVFVVVVGIMRYQKRSWREIWG